MTLAEMQATLYDTLTFDSPPTIVVNRLLRYLNQVYRQTLSKKNVGTRTRRALMTFQTVANSSFAVLPQAASSVFLIADRTNNRILDELTLPSARLRDPGLLFSTGTPYGYVIYRLQDAVSKDPSAAGQLTVVSTGADTPTAFVEVTRTGGYQQTASVTMTTTTPANIGPTDSVLVEKFYLSAPAVGTVTLVDGASNTIATIPIGRTSARYSRLMIVDTPSSALTLTADVELAVFDLANAYDEPLLPVDYHDCLVSGALAKEYKKRRQLDLYGAEMREYNERVGAMQAFIMKTTGPSFPGGRRPIQWSQLGAYYPANS